MANETIELTEVQAILDGLSSPTDEEFVQAVRAYSDGAVASAAAKRGFSEAAAQDLIDASIAAAPSPLVNPVATGQVMYVSPNGSNSRNGSSPRDAKLTIQAAHDALPSAPAGGQGGGVVILSGEIHQITAPILLNGAKPTIFAAFGYGHRPGRYGSADVLPTQTAIIQSLGTLPRIFERIKTDTGSISSGFQWLGLCFDMSDETPLGIYAEWICHGIIRDCFFTGPQTYDGAEQRMLDNTGGGGGAGDNAWWRITENVTRICGGPLLSGNQQIVAYNVFFPGGAGDGIKFAPSADRCLTFHNNIEGLVWGAYYPISLQAVTRSSFIGDVGEGSGQTYLKAVGCGQCEFDPKGFNAPGASDLLIDDDASGGNHLPALTVVHSSGSYSGGQFKRVSVRDASGFVGRKLVHPNLAHIPVPIHLDRRPIFTPQINVLLNTLTAEFWDGDSWEAWAPTNLQSVIWPNADAFTVDATHQRFRIITGAVGRPGGDTPLVTLRCNPTAGSSRSLNFLVDRLDDAAAVVEAGVARTIPIFQNTFLGVAFPLPFVANSRRYRIECDFTAYFANGGTSFSVKFLGMDFDSYLTDLNPPAAKILVGSGTPETVVSAPPNSLYFRTDAVTFYWKSSGTGNTGWLQRGLNWEGAFPHTGTTLGFYATAPVTKATAYTQTFSTADKTLGAYTSDPESGAYTGAADSEAKLADLNALRVAYENLRVFTEDLAAFTNSICDDLQRVGLVG